MDSNSSDTSDVIYVANRSFPATSIPHKNKYVIHYLKELRYNDSFVKFLYPPQLLVFL